MATILEGGTEEQRELLESVLAGLDNPAVEAVAIEAWVDDFEEYPSLGLVPTADEIEASRGSALRLVEPQPPSIRAQWELRLVAAAFRTRSAELGLDRVVTVHTGDGSMTLNHTPELIPPLAADEVHRMRREITTVVTDAGGDLKELTVLHPAGHAWALSLRVAEPHAFLRQELRQMLEALEPWTEACGRQRYVEIRDGEPHPVLVLAQYAYGGMSSVRSDVTCCSPLAGTRPIDAPPTPACPVFG